MGGSIILLLCLLFVLWLHASSVVEVQCKSPAIAAHHAFGWHSVSCAINAGGYKCLHCITRIGHNYRTSMNAITWQVVQRLPFVTRGGMMLACILQLYPTVFFSHENLDRRL